MHTLVNYILLDNHYICVCVCARNSSNDCNGGLLEWESVPERVPGRRSDSGMVMRATWLFFVGMVFRAIVLFLYAQFDVYGPGDEMGVFLLVGEVVVIVVVVMGVVNIVGVVATEGEHSEECNVEEEAMPEVAEKVAVKTVVENEVGGVHVVELVGGETVLGGTRWRGLLMDPPGRVALSIFS